MFRVVSLFKIVIGEMRCGRKHSFRANFMFTERSHVRQSTADAILHKLTNIRAVICCCGCERTGAKCFNRILSLLSLVSPSSFSSNPPLFSRLVYRWVLVPLRRSIPTLTAVSNLESCLVPHPWPIFDKARCPQFVMTPWCHGL